MYEAYVDNKMVQSGFLLIVVEPKPNPSETVVKANPN